MHAPADTTVALADCPGSGRAALATLIAATPGVTLAGEAATVDELHAIARDAQPDVVVIDDRLLRNVALRAADLGARLIVTGVDDDPAYAARARRIGADAWVAKDLADELLPAVLRPAEQVRLAA
jgi:DNA-binding NarL/FixJ family response regulator